MSIMKKGDILLAGLVIAAALALWGLSGLRENNSSGRLVAVIKSGGRIIEEVCLDDEKEARQIPIDKDFRQIILVQPGRIRYLESDCPRKYCVSSGWLDKAGDFAVCIPNRTMVVLQRRGGNNEEDIDGISY